MISKWEGNRWISAVPGRTSSGLNVLREPKDKYETMEHLFSGLKGFRSMAHALERGLQHPLCLSAEIGQIYYLL